MASRWSRHQARSTWPPSTGPSGWASSAEARGDGVARGCCCVDVAFISDRLALTLPSVGYRAADVAPTRNRPRGPHPPRTARPASLPAERRLGEFCPTTRPRRRSPGFAGRAGADVLRAWVVPVIPIGSLALGRGARGVARPISGGDGFRSARAGARPAVAPGGPPVAH